MGINWNVFQFRNQYDSDVTVWSPQVSMCTLYVMLRCNYTKVLCRDVSIRLNIPWRQSNRFDGLYDQF